MSYRPAPRRSVVANAIYGLFNPLPFGFFVAALIFDVVYDRSGEILWMKGAAWLIVIGLLFAIIPRLVNLVQVWITSRRTTVATERFDFWLNLIAIAVAVINAFVHSRDAYAVMPAGVWLSALTVLLLAVAHIVIATQPTTPGNLA
ncbi:hypothetical protein BJI69_06215 [Luteibacter rhizovicinus DSM 16549]|uniref:Uncharacterized protein n=1 Tax=Luteibacter rhizovicinus DSM 16549 TaxID=1440763 RepID=A0A0G9HG72_9GAMM|nr:DUF2231 domain-containing protein [Luteibacter rhizovicinus]APG03544.1 hypothetical protein BJI69_06215 [Luteibacter rhizovicinus DSM 16549]KLD68708.1 hypothetical protein Y883_00040 [Luteibacter rhizovicinus DSM 16549]KLD73055.1 hypothetical protein Y886_40100 [Xanthomonas hyacinthi DSM 19077]